MNKTHNPAGIAAPFSNYAHGVEAPANARWLYVSGQLGITKDGAVPEDFKGQAELAFRNVIAVLEEAGMAVTDIVRVNTYLTDTADIGSYRGIRDRMLNNHTAASTMLVISALATPQFKIEIEVVAAKA